MKEIQLFIDAPKAAGEIEQFLKNTLKKTPFQNIVVGLSGGIDSTVACALAVRALGSSSVYIATLPYGTLCPKGMMYAQEVVRWLSCPSSHVYKKNIQPIVDAFCADNDGLIRSVRKGNIMARVRMTILFDLAKKYDALVLGTENKTEHVLGYYTRFGDEASDIEPLRHLYKTQVQQLAKFLGVPDSIQNSIPTAGLWDGQTDEGEFGFSYKEADQILFLSQKQKKSLSDIISLGYEKQTVEKVFARVEANHYKQILPYAVREE